MDASVSAMSSGQYSILTPWLLPPTSPKKANAGDGFILDSVEKLIGKPAAFKFSSRERLGPPQIDAINSTRVLVVAGANILRDDFRLVPDFSDKTLREITVPIALMGVGHYGIATVTQKMNGVSVGLLAAMLERFPLVSLRCQGSVDYMQRSAPELSRYFTLTSCPVAFPVDGLFSGFARKPEYDRLVVTLTDREYLPQQLPILQFASTAFKAKNRILSLHQNYGNLDLVRFAKSRGYDVFFSADYRDYIDLYRDSDVHFGNRLHAHLKFLSMGKVSFLTPFDLRQVFFSETLDFPLITKSDQRSLLDYDFRRFVARRDGFGIAMSDFVARVKSFL